MGLFFLGGGEGQCSGGRGDHLGVEWWMMTTIKLHLPAFSAVVVTVYCLAGLLFLGCPPVEWTPSFADTLPSLTLPNRTIHCFLCIDRLPSRLVLVLHVLPVDFPAEMHCDVRSRICALWSSQLCKLSFYCHIALIRFCKFSEKCQGKGEQYRSPESGPGTIDRRGRYFNVVLFYCAQGGFICRTILQRSLTWFVLM